MWTVAEVKEVMDDAIRHSQKASAKKLMRESFLEEIQTSQTVLFFLKKDF